MALTKKFKKLPRPSCFSLTRVELVSLKNVFFASSVKCVLVVCIYNCAHLRQNLLKNSAFKVLRSFYAQKINKTRKPSAIIRPYNQGDWRRIMQFFAVKTFRVRLSSGYRYFYDSPKRVPCRSYGFLICSSVFPKRRVRPEKLTMALSSSLSEKSGNIFSEKYNSA